MLAPLIEQLDGRRAPWLPGYRVKIIDGNCIAASDRRLKALREVQGGALPGKSLVVYGFCRKFSFEAICGMVSPLTHAAKEERDDGDQLQRGSFPTNTFATNEVRWPVVV